jgi:hypothetical protein
LNPDKLYAERCREVPIAGLSGQGGRVRSADDSYKIAAGQSSIPQTGGHVSGTCAGRRARGRSIVEKDRENEPDMTTYPLDFHRRAATARESTPQAARVGHGQRGQEGSGRSESRDILGRSPWLREIGQWLRAGYNAVDHPLPAHLAALLKELKRRHR